MSEQQPLNLFPIHQSLSKPDLVFGCERQLLLFSGMITTILVVVLMNMIAAIVGMVFWFAAIGVLRAMAKSDPATSKVYLRHIRYTAYYPAHSTPFTNSAIHRR
mgnify:CR=1 FL=1|jgi:type IV secretion system protein VirB3